MRLSSCAGMRTWFLCRLPIISGLWVAMINRPFSAWEFPPGTALHSGVQGLAAHPYLGIVVNV
jgi:hypothetical protein